MKRRYKVLGSLAGLLGAALAAAALTLSHNSPCGSAPLLPGNTERMKAIVYRCYGSPEVLKLEEIEQARSIADDRMIVKVHAASVNPLDWHYMRGEPYFMRAMRGNGVARQHIHGGRFRRHGRIGRKECHTVQARR